MKKYQIFDNFFYIQMAIFRRVKLLLILRLLYYYDYSARRERTGQSVSPFYGTFSRRGSNFTPLPSIRGNSSPWRSPHRSPNRSPTRRSPQRPTPMTLVREMSLPPVPSKSRPESVVEKKEKEIGSKSPSDYEKILRRNKTSIELYAQSKYI